MLSNFTCIYKMLAIRSFYHQQNHVCLNYTLMVFLIFVLKKRILKKNNHMTKMHAKLTSKVWPASWLVMSLRVSWLQRLKSYEAKFFGLTPASPARDQFPAPFLISSKLHGLSQDLAPSLVWKNNNRNITLTTGIDTQEFSAKNCNYFLTHHF